VEVLIAAIILFIMLLSANKALLLGMAGTRQGASRTTVESEILNDIEIIQGIDSSLSGDLTGCSDGSSYLEAKIVEAENKAKIKKPKITGSSEDWERITDSTDPTILIISYNFKIPGATNANFTTGVGVEKRVVEINPSFLTECPL
jgi:hypothetical protein